MTKTIVCVDDEPNLLKLYEKVLSDEGFRVLTARDRLTALAAIKSEAVDLVVLDIKLGEQHGLDLLAEIRQDRPALPVLLHSAFHTYKSDFKSWLANDYLVKSSDLTELRSKISELLHI